MAKIFISYSNQDAQIAQYITERINEAGHTTFIEDSDIPPGMNFGEAITNALVDTDIVIILYTKNAVISSWVNYEMNTAFGYLKERGKPRIIPVVFDDVIELPDILKNIIHIRASRDMIDYLATNLINSINRLIGEIKAKSDEKKEVQQRVEKVAADYIKKSLEELKEREGNYRNLAYICYILAYLPLIACAIYTIWRASVNINSSLTLTAQIQFNIISVIAISLIIGISRFAFILGKSFMVESLRNADRIHAISFGEFYLNAYGEKAEWEEVKEAFQHWNIDKGSYFINQNVNDYDPELMKNAIELLKLISNKRSAN